MSLLFCFSLRGPGGPTGRPLGPPSFCLCEPHSKAFLIPVPAFVTRQNVWAQFLRDSWRSGGPSRNFSCMDPNCTHSVLRWDYLLVFACCASGVAVFSVTTINMNRSWAAVCFAVEVWTLKNVSNIENRSDRLHLLKHVLTLVKGMWVVVHVTLNLQ